MCGTDGEQKKSDERRVVASSMRRQKTKEHTKNSSVILALGPCRHHIIT